MILAGNVRGAIMSNGKLIFVDLIRIVSMLLIVFWHVIANTNDFGYLKFGEDS
jgi:hypothetical protein